MPPVVAFSIGSFGDILAVLQLLYKLRGAVNELTGAAAEMRVLIDDIDRWTRALIQVKAVLERRASEIQADVSNGICVAVATCEKVLCTSLRTVEDFKCRITRATGVVGWRSYCAVLSWSVLGGKHRVDALRTTLFEQLDVIQLYLALSQSCGQANIQESLESQGATLRRLCDVVQDIQLRFDVGIPSFMFWDQRERRYCTPLARTSLDRFRDIYNHYIGVPCTALQPPHGGTEVRRLSLRLIAFGLVCDGPSMAYSTHGGYSTSIECFLFQENAFGQWQALVSIPSSTKEVPDAAPVIKLLLERPHGPRGPCNCIGESCRSRLHSLFERHALFRQRLDAYEAAARAFAASIFDSDTPQILAPVHHAACAALASADSARLFEESHWGRMILRWRRDLDPESFESAIRQLSPSELQTLINYLPNMVRKEAYPLVILCGRGKIAFINAVEHLLELI